MRIGILTSGGDAPGMNPAIRAVTRCALDKGMEVVGIHEGWQGVVDGGDTVRAIQLAQRRRSPSVRRHRPGHRSLGGIPHRGRPPQGRPQPGQRRHRRAGGDRRGRLTNRSPGAASRVAGPSARHWLPTR